MSLSLRLCFVGDGAVLTRVADQRQPSFLARLRGGKRPIDPQPTGSWSPELPAQPFEFPLQWPTTTGPAVPANVETHLAQALELECPRGRTAGRTVLDVRFGFRTSFVVLMRAETDLRHEPHADRVIGAWLERRLNVQASSLLVRWQPRRPGLILVSCIPRELYATMQRVAAQRGLILGPCIPAVLERLEQLEAECARRGKPSATFTWSESGGSGRRRNEVAQMFRIERDGVSAEWRGWLDAPPKDEPDRQFDGALRRFRVTHGAPGDEQILGEHWDVSGESHL